jgi:PAS domain S-box-containing protein
MLRVEHGRHVEVTVAGDEELQHHVEVILVRQLASYLATPIFVVDPDGKLLYFNESAEGILGRRYEEAGEMPHSEWASIFDPTDEHGRSLPPEQLPLSIAMAQRRPAHGPLWIRGLDGQRRHIAVTAFPMVGQEGRYLGAVALFWERAEP